MPHYKPTSRRTFLQQTTLATFSGLLGTEIAFAEHIFEGWTPLALTDLGDPFSLKGKHKDLVVLNDKPINAEVPPHLLNDKITPTDKLFVRNNGIPPIEVDTKNWTLTIEGEAAKQKVVLTLADLKSKFKHYTYQLTLECGGNGRSEFNPPAKGNQWTTGAVGSPKWTGVKLKEVLEYVGINANAIYIGYYGKDTHLSGDPKKVVISRGVPINKALEEESLIAWAMNGEDLPLQNGYPLRLVFSDVPASTSGKWLYKIVVRDRVHDGPKMTGQSYRVPCEPVAAGSTVADEKMCIIEDMPVKSLITYPKTGAVITLGRTLDISGQAWAGKLAIKEMHCSIDYGATWQKCTLDAPANRYAWQHWSAKLSFPQKGYYEIWARATDGNSEMQPMVLPGWNPRGYLNNACHRIAVMVK